MNVQEFYLILKVGLNLVNIIGEVDFKVCFGFNIGLGGDVMLIEWFGIEIGVYYFMQGSKYKGGGVFYMDKLDYINVLVYVKEFIYKGLYVFGGLQFSFNVNLENKLFFDYGIIVIGMNVICKFDCGVGFGVGYQFECGLLIFLNYNIGLINVNKFWVSDFNFKVNNSVVQLNVGWCFVL